LSLSVFILARLARGLLFGKSLMIMSRLGLEPIFLQNSDNTAHTLV
jgi:hypothetical protein